MAQETVRLKIKGMSCQGCADTIGRHLKREKGVGKISIDWKAGSGEVVIDPAVTSPERIIHAGVFQSSYSASIDE